LGRGGAFNMDALVGLFLLATVISGAYFLFRCFAEKKFLSRPFFFASAMFVGFCICAYNDPNDSDTASSSKATSAVATDAPVADATDDSSSSNDATSDPNAVSPNGSTVGGLKYTIGSATLQQSIADTVGDPTQAAGVFIVLPMTVSNVGSHEATLSEDDFHLERDGKEYDATNDSFAAGGFNYDQINPGVTRSGYIFFDVPVGSTPSSYKIKVFGNANEGDQEYMLLGLQ